MNDMLDQIEAVHREVAKAGGGAHRMLLRRSYDATVEEVWDALTDADRITRWLMPVTGDLKLGGHYQLEGNAGGEILECDAPKRLKVTWVYGEPTGISELEVRLSPSDDGTVFELEHVAEVPEEFWGLYGPGATGIGWDLSLLGLRDHLAGHDLTPEQKAAAAESPELREFMTLSNEAWSDAYRAYGAPEDLVARVHTATLAAYLPDLADTPDA